jgi:hypothetical protein
VSAAGGRDSRRWLVGATVATVGLAIAAALVAMAGRSPLSSAAPVNGASAQASVTALFLLLIGLGIVAFVALVILMWPGRGSDEPEFVPAAPRVHWISKVIAILLALTLAAALVAAAIVGTHGAQRASGLASGGLGEVGAVPGRSVAARTPAGSGFVLPAWLPWTLIAIVALGVTVAVAVLFVRREIAVDRAPGDGVARAAVRAAIGALDTAEDPRSAVIAAYRAMEGTFAAHGLARSATEAPREYLRRVLALRSADDGEARTLTNLFEEARYSTHPVSERVRELALATLRRLRARLDIEDPR